MSRDTSAPPALPGYAYLDYIGGGGFADVFLYEQQMPLREVAVKVLVASEAHGTLREKFNTEANVMAQLSSHGSIVPIYQAGVSSDDRPYLVMEFCPLPNLAERYRHGAMAVPEVLESMIQIAGAVETAHRAGILHRDIKPHNVLTNAFGYVKLTDFGIAHSGDQESDDVGMSVPWSPPEAFWEHPPADVRSEVWSLAATTYTLLAGRSPFEVAGGANDSHTLMSRIERQLLTPLTRVDVSDELNDVLATAMSKDLADRYPSAIAFARRLQDVQISLTLAPTRIEVLDASPVVRDAPEDDSRTRVRPVSIIVPDAPVVLKESDRAVSPLVSSPPPSVIDDETFVKGKAKPLGSELSAAVPDTMEKASGAIGTLESEAPAELDDHKSRAGVFVAAAIAVLVLAAVGIAFALGGDPKNKTSDRGLSDSDGSQGAFVGDETIPSAPTAVHGVVKDGNAVFTWTASGAVKGDEYRWSYQKPLDFLTHDSVISTRLEIPVKAGQIPCVVIRTYRGNQSSNNTDVTCADGGS
jgi:serine/threonine protein kinase